jgi:putative heme-binding domain-containing protein
MSPNFKRFFSQRSILFVLAIGLMASVTAGVTFYRSTARRGAEVYRVMCANCHGAAAQGGRGGPDLTVALAHGERPWDLYKNISRGIPGTGMPPQYLPALDVLAAVAYLRTLRKPAQGVVSGDAAAGSRLFHQYGCDACHAVAGRGHLLGPSLSRIGAMRPAAYLAEKVRNPSKEITNGFETVTVVRTDGQRLTGVRANEDTFSVQIRDVSGNFHSFLKSQVREVIHENDSVMPAYDPGSISDGDLRDLVAYLVNLKGR